MSDDKLRKYLDAYVSSLDENKDNSLDEKKGANIERAEIFDEDFIKGIIQTIQKFEEEMNSYFSKFGGDRYKGKIVRMVAAKLREQLMMTNKDNKINIKVSDLKKEMKQEMKDLQQRAEKD